MTRGITWLLYVLLCNFSFSQESGNDQCYIKPFEVYLTDDQGGFSNIRESPNGEVILKINNVYGYGWIVNVVDFKEGWLKIDSLSGVDGYDVTNLEAWVHTSIVGAGVTHDVEILDMPYGKKRIGKLIGEEDTFKIKEVYCEWIKIESKGIVGWVGSERICGNPVTTCP